MRAKIGRSISKSSKSKLATVIQPFGYIALFILTSVSCSSNPREHQFVDGVATRYYYTLTNGLPVLLYHDKRLPVTTAVAAVASGNYNDPPEYPGLHHLLEHLVLFEDQSGGHGLHLYANSIGGYASAFVSAHHTRFEFVVPNQSSSAALKLLANSMKAVEFSPAAVHTEVKAVHNEFVMDSSKEGKKQYSVFASVNNLTGQDSFGFQGNEDTLLHSGLPPLAKALKDLHAQLYTAQNIALVVFSGEELETIKTAIASSFQEIPEGVDKIRPYGTRFSDASSAKKISTPLASRKNQISIEFPIPSKLFRRGDITRSDIDFVVDALRTGESGGFIERLSSHQLVNHLHIDYSPYPIDSDGRLILYFTIAEDAPQSEEEIVANLFGYIEYLKNVYLDQYFSTEYAGKSVASFKSEPSVLFQASLSARALNHLSIVQVESLFSGTKYSRAGVANILSLMSPSSMRMWDFRSEPDPEHTQVTRWFGQKYSATNLSLTSDKNFDQNVEKASTEFSLQPKKDVASRVFDHYISSPVNILTSIPSDTWLIHNTIQEGNSGVLLAVINSAFGGRDSREYAAMRLLYEYLMDGIPDSVRFRNEVIRINLNEEGNLAFYLQGESTSIQEALISLFKYFDNIEFSEEKADRVILRIVDDVEAAAPPSSFDVFFKNVFDIGFDREILLQEYEKMSVSDLEWAREHIAETAYLRLFAVGSFGREEIGDLSDDLSLKIRRAPLSKNECFVDLESLACEQKNLPSPYVYFPEKRKTGESIVEIETASDESSVLYADVLYENTTDLKANLDVLNAFYYHKLVERFRRELGISYEASSQVIEFRGIAALTTYIASGTSEAQSLLYEISAFREQFSEYLSELSQKEVDNVSSQLIASQSITRVTDEQLFEKYNYDFSTSELDQHSERTLERLKALKEVTPESIQKTFQKLVKARVNGRRVIIKSTGNTS